MARAARGGRGEYECDVSHTEWIPFTTRASLRARLEAAASSTNVICRRRSGSLSRRERHCARGSRRWPRCWEERMAVCQCVAYGVSEWPLSRLPFSQRHNERESPSRRPEAAARERRAEDEAAHRRQLDEVVVSRWQCVAYGSGLLKQRRSNRRQLDEVVVSRWQCVAYGSGVFPHGSLSQLGSRPSPRAPRRARSRRALSSEDLVASTTHKVAGACSTRACSRDDDGGVSRTTESHLVL